jgi:hypothetical protein
MMKEPLKPLSDAIFGPVTRAYKAGGLGLAFLGLGAFLMLVAFLLPDRGLLGYVIVGVGFMLVALTCLLFLFKDVLPLFRLRRSINENRELIDAVQAMALQVTEVASDLQSLAFKHASVVAAVMQEARPLLRRVPVVGRFADSETVVRVDSLSSAIVDYTTRAKGIIGDVEDALVKSDASRLRQYIMDLREVRSELTRLLRA